MISRLSLRVRVAAAFALATALALGLLSAYVVTRVESGLEEQLREPLKSELDRLGALAPPERDAAVQRMTGEVFAQSGAGQDAARSPRLRDDLDIASEGFRDRRVTTQDENERDRELCLILVRRVGGDVLAAGISREDAEATMQSIRRQLLIGGPLALAVASLLGYAVAGTSLRPVESMRARAAEISATSSGDRLPLPRARDEIHRLGTTLNQMLDRLDEALSRQRRFVAEASHELRTPLALLRTEFDLALDRPRTHQELVMALQSASEETERLTALATDLLTLAASDESRLPLDVEPVDLAALARCVVARLGRSVGDERDITVHSTGPAIVAGDRMRLDQVVANLLHNAIRHGAGPIRVTASTTPQETVLTVADSGTGYPTEVLRSPGERFGDDAAGRGLGLAIVTAIVEAHGGTLNLKNESGAIATIRFPYANRV